MSEAATTAPSKVRATLSPVENLGVGISGGCLETALLMPILTWKFCAQEGRPYPRFPGMYRGVFVQASSVAPLTAMQMVVNGLFENMLTGGKRGVTDAEAIGCALAAGATSASLYGPVDLTSIHQQKLNMSPIATVQHLVREHGALIMWRGVVPTAVREAIYTGGYLGLAPFFTKSLMAQKGWEEAYFASAVLGSLGAGVIANVASQPIDTAKTVVQADLRGVTYTGMVQALGELNRKEGLMGMYRGGIARTLRTSGAFFVVSSIREMCVLEKSKR